MKGQTIIIILLSLIVFKLYQNLIFITLTLTALIFVGYCAKAVFSWLLGFKAARKALWYTFLGALATIPVGIAYLIDVFFPKTPERWMVVLCLYAAAAIVGAIIFTVNFIGRWISQAPERKKENEELRAISKSLKDIDYMEKRVKKLK